jgi:hypothetical protein
MNEFEKFGTSTKFRDIMRKFISAQIERDRPRYRYATVVSIPSADKCEVQFPGESSTVTVNCTSVVPLSAGQTVRVEGLRGDRYIADVTTGGSTATVLFAYDYMIVP